jgi:hypothetical protein
VCLCALCSSRECVCALVRGGKEVKRGLVPAVWRGDMSFPLHILIMTAAIFCASILLLGPGRRRDFCD